MKTRIETYITLETEVTIFLDRRDWYEIQESKVWTELEKYIDHLEKERNRQRLQAREY